MSIRVTKEKLNGGVTTCRHVTMRERLLRKLLGKPVRLTVIVPGDSVEGITITELPEEKEEANGNQGIKGT